MRDARALFAVLCVAGRVLGAPIRPNRTQAAARSLKGIEMNGKCAVLGHHDVWTDIETDESMWDYKIKVFPWVVYGKVKIVMSPPVTVVDIWAADLLSDTVIGSGEDVSPAPPTPSLAALP